MIGIGLGLNRRHYVSSGGFDVSYQAVLDEGTTGGYTLPSDAHQALQSQLVADLKSLGAWDKIDAFYSFAGTGDADFSVLDWKNPGVKTPVFVNSPTKSNDGFTFNGSSNYIDLDFIPGTDGDGNWNTEEAGIGIVHFVDPVNNAYNGCARALYRIYPGAAGTIFNLNNTYDVNSAAGFGSLLNKHLHADQDSSSGTVKTYYSGTEGHSTAKGPSAYPTQTFSVGANHTATSTYGNFVDGGISILYFSGSLRAEVSSLSTLIENYINAL